MAIIILLYTLILLRLIIAVALYDTAHQNHQPNLYWLSIAFFTYMFSYAFAQTAEGNPLSTFPGSAWFFSLTVISALPLIVFIHTTFYINKRSPAGWMIAVVLVMSAIVFYCIGTGVNPLLWMAIMSTTNAMVWLWHAWISYQAWRGVACETGVDDWIKARYRMMVAYSALLVVLTLVTIIRLVVGADSLMGNLMAFIGLLSQITSVVLQFLTWVMPEGFRSWLNRNYHEELEEEIVLEV